MADLSEVWKGMRDILIGDATLTAMLSSAGAVYERDPPLDVAFPMLTLWQLTDGPVNNSSGFGLFNADIQIDVWSTSPRTNEQIKSRLDELLQIPRVRSTGIVTDNYNVFRCYRTRSTFAGTVAVENEGKKIRHLATEWRASIKPT
jgi:hypothetical protein